MWSSLELSASPRNGGICWAAKAGITANWSRRCRRQPSAGPTRSRAPHRRRGSCREGGGGEGRGMTPASQGVGLGTVPFLVHIRAAGVVPPAAILPESTGDGLFEVQQCGPTGVRMTREGTRESVSSLAAPPWWLTSPSPLSRPAIPWPSSRAIRPSAYRSPEAPDEGAEGRPPSSEAHALSGSGQSLRRSPRRPVRWAGPNDWLQRVI